MGVLQFSASFGIVVSVLGSYFSGMGLNPSRSTEKVVSRGWFTSECFICDMAFYDLFVLNSIILHTSMISNILPVAFAEFTNDSTKHGITHSLDV